MKDLICIFIIGLYMLAVLPVAAAQDAYAAHKKRKAFRVWSVNEGIMLMAIATVETGQNPRAIGPVGERTQYQFIRSTWRDYSKFDFADAADNYAEADRVAMAHLRRITAHLCAEPGHVTAENILAAWKYGISRAMDPKCARSDYAKRGANIYFDLLP